MLVADQRVLNSREFHRSRASAQEDKRTLAGSHLDRICIRVSILPATGKLLDHTHTSFEGTVCTWTHWIYTFLKKSWAVHVVLPWLRPFCLKDTTVLWQFKARVDWEKTPPTISALSLIHSEKKDHYDSYPVTPPYLCLWTTLLFKHIPIVLYVVFQTLNY